MFKVPEKFRVKEGMMRTTKEHGNNGVFLLYFENNTVNTIASDGMGWEHVSVSIPPKSGGQPVRCPTWEEMCMVKKLFWDEEDCVIQYHPPKKDYVNCHPHVLHLWRPTNKNIPTPPSMLIGPK